MHAYASPPRVHWYLEHQLARLPRQRHPEQGVVWREPRWRAEEAPHLSPPQSHSAPTPHLQEGRREGEGRKERGREGDESR